MEALTGKKRKSTGPKDYTGEVYNGMLFETKSNRFPKTGGIVKICSCASVRKGIKCPARVEVTRKNGCVEIQPIGEHTCTLLKVLPRRTYCPVVFDDREKWSKFPYAPGHELTREKKKHIDELLAGARASLRPLTGGNKKRFYIPGFYDDNAPEAVIRLREYLLLLFNHVIVAMKNKYHGLREFRIGLIVSYDNASSQSVPHYDYDSLLRHFSPEYRAMSCLMSIDGFGFTYLGDNDKWQEEWCSEGTWLAFSDGCLHFGAGNTFSRPAVRAFLYCVSDAAHFPPDNVYPPEKGSFPDPEKKAYKCYEDQDPDFKWTFLPKKETKKKAYVRKSKRKT
jgi:hypothetical protein